METWCVLVFSVHIVFCENMLQHDIKQSLMQSDLCESAFIMFFYREKLYEEKLKQQQQELKQLHEERQRLMEIQGKIQDLQWACPDLQVLHIFLLMTFSMLLL